MNKPSEQKKPTDQARTLETIVERIAEKADVVHDICPTHEIEMVSFNKLPHVPRVPGIHRGHTPLLICPECRKLEIVEARARIHKERIENLDEYMLDQGVPLRYHKFRRSNWIGQWPKNATIHDEGITLIHGPVGTGKTHVAVALLAEYFIDHGSGKYWHSVELIEELKREVGEDRKTRTLDKLTDFDFLVLDDFGSERGTEFAIYNISYIIEFRYANCQPTIITTNLTPNELHATDKRLASRMFAGNVVHLTGEDRRLKGFKASA